MSNEFLKDKSVNWDNIKNKLGELRQVEGGFTKAIRGILTLDDGRKVFVKCGVDDQTNKWIKREILVYRFLELSQFSHTPNLLSVNDDETGFAITACLLDDGWDWKANWSDARIKKTLEAMDLLSQIKPVGKYLELFLERNVNENDDGWLPLLESTELQQKLLERLSKFEGATTVGVIDFQSEVDRVKNFVFKYTDLVHNDIRADNCAWNNEKREVMIVDWNWAQLGDRRVDISATLVDVALSGFDISSFYDRLDTGALHWLAGFWLKSSVQPGPENLREFQLKSGIMALQLLRIRESYQWGNKHFSNFLAV